MMHKHKQFTGIVGNRVLAIVMIFLGTNLYASECGVLQYLAAKSSDVSIQNNQCSEPAKMSLNTEFELNSEARLWLKSIPHLSSDAHFQVICQNQSKDSIKLSISSPFMPWLKAKALTNCTAWINNKLSCADSQGNSNRLICVIGAIKKPGFEQVARVERKASVNMRAVDTDLTTSTTAAFDFNPIIIALRPEIGLCRNLYQVNQPINVSFTVNATAKAINIQQDPFVNQQFSACIKTVVSDFAYPEMLKNQVIRHNFE